MLKEDRPYQLRDLEGNPVTMTAGKSLVRERFRVPEEVRRLRRHHNRPKKKENLPQEVPFPSFRRSGEATAYLNWGAQKRTRFIPINPASPFEVGRWSTKKHRGLER